MCPGWNAHDTCYLVVGLSQLYWVDISLTLSDYWGCGQHVFKSLIYKVEYKL